MGAKTIQTAFRFTDNELALYDEVAERLGISRVEAARLGLHALKREMGLDRDDVVLLHERLASRFGDDAKLLFTIRSVGSQEVDVSMQGEPCDDLRAHLLFVALESQGTTMTLPPEATVVMKDLAQEAWYTIGAIPLKDDATKEVPLKALPDLRQGTEEQTAEERRASVRMNSLLRRLSRESQELDGD